MHKPLNPKPQLHAKPPEPKPAISCRKKMNPNPKPPNPPKPQLSACFIDQVVSSDDLIEGLLSQTKNFMHNPLNPKRQLHAQIPEPQTQTPKLPNRSYRRVSSTKSSAPTTRTAGSRKAVRGATPSQMLIFKPFPAGPASPVCVFIDSGKRGAG